MSIFRRSNMRRSRFGLEMIDIQNDRFGHELELLFEDIRATAVARSIPRPADYEKLDTVKDVEKAIFSRLGLRVAIQTGSYPAATMPFYANKNHIFLNEFWRGEIDLKDQKKLLRELEKNRKPGFVDTKKAKLGGFFSEHEHDLYLHFEQLFNNWKLSAGEVAAVALHEVGHDFTTCEYSDRLESANQVLTALAQDLLSKREKTNVEYVYRELEKVNANITMEEADKLVNGKPIVAGAVWFKAVIGTVRSQMAECTYDKTSSEQMADNFAARFGYGRQLISALEKIHEASGPNPERSKGWYFFAFIMQSIQVLVYPMLAVTLLSGGAIFTGVLFAALWFLAFLNEREDIRDYTYDELKLRYIRVRNQIVELLKDPRIKKEKLQDAVADIRFMDSVIDKTMVYKGPFRLIANLVFSGARGARSAVLEQQLLEELAFNDLFVKSAELKTL